VKKQVYISIFSLIIFGILALLNNYSVQYNGSVSEKQNLEIRKSSPEKWNIPDLMDDHLRINGYQSAVTILFEEPPVEKEIHLTALSHGQLLSNPSLYDLPPPYLKFD
jgi:hypothetical protein